MLFSGLQSPMPGHISPVDVDADNLIRSICIHTYAERHLFQLGLPLQL